MTEPSQAEVEAAAIALWRLELGFRPKVSALESRGLLGKSSNLPAGSRGGSEGVR